MKTQSSGSTAASDAAPRGLHFRLSGRAGLFNCEDNPIRPGNHFPDTPHTLHNMRLTSIVSALALMFASVSALDKPLDIQVDKAVECTRKTKSGKRPPPPQQSMKVY